MTTAVQRPMKGRGPRHARPRLLDRRAHLDEVENIDELLAADLRARGSVPFEVVVVDDASTDGTVERVRAWAETRPVR